MSEAPGVLAGTAPDQVMPSPGRAFPRAGIHAEGATESWGVRARHWAYDTFFRGVHGNRLVYNACWEDPAIDRQLLRLDEHSRVVMITSAGCNALDYLLDDPAEIHAIDVNPRQNALLDLKVALLAEAEWEDLFAVFGRGAHPGIAPVLRRLAPQLPAASREFWDRKRHYLDGSHFKRSFYFHGSSGDVAWMLRTLVLQRCPELRRLLEGLLSATSVEEQQSIFAQVEPRFWNRFTRWFVRQPAVLSLLGVPRPQARLITREWPGGMEGFLREKLRHIATQLPMAENYFWRVYMTGSYAEQCCPSYLRRESSALLRRRVERVRTHTCLLAEFLRANPGIYSHYVLLDHQDWLAWHDPAALAEEWRLIFENSRPGTRVLFRSAAPRVEFLPPSVTERVRFHPEETGPLHPFDRVGTYGSVHVAEVLDR